MRQIAKPLSIVVREQRARLTSLVTDPGIDSIIERTTSPEAILQYVESDELEAYQTKTDEELVEDAIEELDDAGAYLAALMERGGDKWGTLLMLVLAVRAEVRGVARGDDQ